MSVVPPLDERVRCTGCAESFFVSAVGAAQLRRHGLPLPALCRGCVGRARAEGRRASQLPVWATGAPLSMPCQTCDHPFTVSADEQDALAARFGCLAKPPVHCRACRADRRQRRAEREALR